MQRSAILGGLVAALLIHPAHAQQGSLGGGFIEFLMRGGETEAPSAPPPGYYAPQPTYARGYGQPQYAPAQAVAPRVLYAPRDPSALGTGPTTYLQPQDEPPPSYVAAPQPDLYAPQPRRQALVSPPAGDPRAIDPKYLRHEVAYDGPEKPGTIVIDTPERFLYLVQEGGKALRWGIGVGRPGFTWAGVHTVTSKREWPDWVPPPEMLKRQPYLPRRMAGGPNNPLGARALYLGSTLYRIHGSNEPWTIGRAVSSGCIRMRNEDVIDLYERVPVGAKVVVI